MINSSKAQIAIFVVIATLLVLAIGIFFTINSDSAVKVFSSDKSSYKVKEFVEDCMEVKSREAVDMIGRKGGWLYHPESLRFIEMNTNEMLVKKMDGISFFKDNIPYWYYYDDNSKTFKTRIPEYDSENEFSLKNQIKKYIDDELDACIKGFSSFEDIYDIDYEPRKTDSSVEIYDEKIIVSLYLPLKILEKNTQNLEYVEEFRSSVENKLRVPYHLAKEVVNAQSKSSFIEHQTLSIITTYQSSQGRENLPPFYDFKIGEYDRKPWFIPEVEERVKQILSSNIGLIQFKNTDDKVFSLPERLEDNAFARGVLSSFNRDYLSETSLYKENDKNLFEEFSEYSITPEYLPFIPMHFSITNSLGDIILFPKPEFVTHTKLIPIGYTDYSSVYQMAYPITFKIRNSEENDNFVFNLLIEGNIDHNTPLSENIDFEISEEFEESAPGTLVCDPVQFLSRHVSLNISDPVNFGKIKELDGPTSGIDGAMVTFNCRNINTCYIGETSAQKDDEQTKLKFRLPVNCNPGTLEIYKKDHKRVIIENLNPNQDESINLGNVSMPSKKELNLEVKVVERSSGSLGGRVLAEHEKGFIIMQNLEDDTMVEVVELNRENQFDQTIDLVPGNYSIEGYLIYENEINIPEDCIKVQKDGLSGLLGGEKCEKVPALNLSSWITGAIQLDRVNIDLENLILKDKFVINFVELGETGYAQTSALPRKHKDIEEMAEIMDDIKELSMNKRPYFKSE